MVSILLQSALSSPAIDVIITIFRRHGIAAGRVPSINNESNMRWGENRFGYVKLGPIYVSMGYGQNQKEDGDVLDAAESLCLIRLTELKMT